MNFRILGVLFLLENSIRQIRAQVTTLPTLPTCNLGFDGDTTANACRCDGSGLSYQNIGDSSMPGGCAYTALPVDQAPSATKAVSPLNDPDVFVAPLTTIKNADGSSFTALLQSSTDSNGVIGSWMVTIDAVANGAPEPTGVSLPLTSVEAIPKPIMAPLTTITKSDGSFFTALLQSTRGSNGAIGTWTITVDAVAGGVPEPTKAAQTLNSASTALAPVVTPLTTITNTDGSSFTALLQIRTDSNGVLATSTIKVDAVAAGQPGPTRAPVSLSSTGTALKPVIVPITTISTYGSSFTALLQQTTDSNGVPGTWTVKVDAIAGGESQLTGAAPLLSSTNIILAPAVTTGTVDTNAEGDPQPTGAASPLISSDGALMLAITTVISGSTQAFSPTRFSDLVSNTGFVTITTKIGKTESNEGATIVPVPIVIGPGGVGFFGGIGPLPITFPLSNWWNLLTGGGRGGGGGGGNEDNPNDPDDGPDDDPDKTKTSEIQTSTCATNEVPQCTTRCIYDATSSRCTTIVCSTATGCMATAYTTTRTSISEIPLPTMDIEIELKRPEEDPAMEMLIVTYLVQLYASLGINDIAADQAGTPGGPISTTVEGVSTAPPPPPPETTSSPPPPDTTSLTPPPDTTAAPPPPETPPPPPPPTTTETQPPSEGGDVGAPCSNLEQCQCSPDQTPMCWKGRCLCGSYSINFGPIETPGPDRVQTCVDQSLALGVVVCGDFSCPGEQKPICRGGFCVCVGCESPGSGGCLGRRSEIETTLKKVYLTSTRT